MIGKLFIVATPIGNLKDFTQRAVEVLKSVDIIAAEDTRRTRKLLNFFEIKKPMISYHDFNKEKRIPKIIKMLKEGKSVALVSDAGTPCISDPGYNLIVKAIEEEIEVIPIPGVSAVTAAISVCGLPCDRFVFEGFLPRKKKKRKERLEKLKNEERTIILFESPHRISKTLKELLEELGDRRCVFLRELTKKFEEIKRGRLSDIIKELKNGEVKGEITLVIEGKGG